MSLSTIINSKLFMILLEPVNLFFLLQKMKEGQENSFAQQLDRQNFLTLSFTNGITVQNSYLTILNMKNCRFLIDFQMLYLLLLMYWTGKLEIALIVQSFCALF